jgi:hypothetical protein
LNHIGGLESPDWIKEYPGVFNGLGTMGDPYEIKLKPNIQPHAIFSLRKVPLSYRLKLKGYCGHFLTYILYNLF